MPLPFAFSTDKSEFVFSVRPTLVEALQAARDRYKHPYAMLGITAWFPDGNRTEIPYEEMVIFEENGCEKDWITDEEAAALALRLFPSPENRKSA